VHVTTVDRPEQLARMMWAHFEPVHAVTYFHPRAVEAYSAVGLRGFWRSYFAGRSAPLGPVSAAPVVAAFFSFAPSMVARALPAVWQLATPEQVLQARLTGAVQALAELTRDQPESRLTEAADLLEAAASELDPAGRVRGAANAALPRADQPLARLWQAATTLREHRGDGHVAAVVAADLDPVETLAWRASVDLPRAALQPNRGWTDEQWQGGVERLTARGWLTRDGRPTDRGIAAFQAIEDATDAAAARPWRMLGSADTQRLRELLAPVALACRAMLPFEYPIGLPALVS
jgi:hypothetical protein